MDPRQLARLINPALALVANGEMVGFDGPDAVTFLVGIAAVESRLRLLRQVGGGPALGLWQIEPATHDDLLASWLDTRPEVRSRVLSLRAEAPARHVQLASNLAYGAVIARLLIWRAPARLPRATDVPGQAKVWKQYYNTAGGAGTEEKYIHSFNELVAKHLPLL